MLVPIVVITVAAMLVDWWTRLDERREHLEAIVKPLATAGVIALAVLGADQPSSAVTISTVVALVLCLIGDIALLPQIDRFVVGLSAFLVGHLAFIAAFAAHGIHHVSLLGGALVAAGLLIATVGITIARGAADRNPALRRPVLAYLIVIAAMAAIAWGTGHPIVLIGATSFVISDSVLGWRQFVRPIRHGAVLVMVTYHLAIGLLALSLW